MMKIQTVSKLCYSGHASSDIYSFRRNFIKKYTKNLEFDFKSLPLQKTLEIFSCLFVKFVLYTAGVLGEGRLLNLCNIQAIFLKNHTFEGVCRFFS